MEKFRSASGESIFFNQRGSGRNIILIHGNLSSSTFFKRTQNALDMSSYAIDLRGFGDSSYNFPTRNLKDYAFDIKDFLIRNDLRDVAVLGWSFGGGVLMELIYDREVNDRISKAIFLSSMAPYPAIEGFRVKEILRDLRDGDIELKYPKNLKKLIVKSVFDNFLYNLKKPPQTEYLENLNASLKQRNSKDIKYILSHYHRELRRPPMDSYVLHGALDRVVNIYAAEVLRRGLDAELKIFNNCGHSIMTDDFDNFIDTLERIIYEDTLK